MDIDVKVWVPEVEYFLSFHCVPVDTPPDALIVTFSPDVEKLTDPVFVVIDSTFSNLGMLTIFVCACDVDVVVVIVRCFKMDVLAKTGFGGGYP